jgi:hypothetical protein
MLFIEESSKLVEEFTGGSPGVECTPTGCCRITEVGVGAGR